ncbi:MAG: 4-phosphopantetheinyl transferase superfamily protein [Sediminibacterium sp.]|nr:4-phosphopantetheinyl transferase superfamily protein [Sediminibacterium sp.]
MQSAGNDIIALDLTDKQRSNDSRFYSKILSESEKKYYCHSSLAGMEFRYFLWLCWSVKESAYKYLKRNQPDLIFSPSRIEIAHIAIPVNRQFAEPAGTQWEGLAKDEKCYSGNLVFEGNTYYFRSKIYREMITTVVNADESFENIFWGFDSIDDTSADHQSEAIRSLLLQKLHTVLPGKQLRIEKAAAGYPIIISGTKQLNIPVSLAHHGPYIAYSFYLPANIRQKTFASLPLGAFA